MSARTQIPAATDRVSTTLAYVGSVEQGRQTGGRPAPDQPWVSAPRRA